MAEVIIMPKLGFNMDNGQLVAWHKKVGEAVKKGEPLFDINTDKTTMPVEATTDGVLLKTLLNEGENAESNSEPGEGFEPREAEKPRHQRISFDADRIYDQRDDG